MIFLFKNKYNFWLVKKKVSSEVILLNHGCTHCWGMEVRETNHCQPWRNNLQNVYRALTMFDPFAK